jgi:hypothetical protein
VNGDGQSHAVGCRDFSAIYLLRDRADCWISLDHCAGLHAAPGEAQMEQPACGVARPIAVQSFQARDVVWPRCGRGPGSAVGEPAPESRRG